VTAGGQPAQVLYAGNAGGEVGGVVQINLQLPAGVTGTVSVIVTNRESRQPGDAHDVDPVGVGRAFLPGLLPADRLSSQSRRLERRLRPRCQRAIARVLLYTLAFVPTFAYRCGLRRVNFRRWPHSPGGGSITPAICYPENVPARIRQPRVPSGRPPSFTVIGIGFSAVRQRQIQQRIVT
jgi:hypothetical protein